MNYTNTYMKRTTELEDYTSVKGIDFNKNVKLKDFINGYKGIGFQASNLFKAIEIAKDMRKSGSKIILSFTGNAISSGLRDIITYLVKNKLVDYIVTSGAGIEEDAIKCFKDFKIGSFDIPGRFLFESGVGRIGNILVPNSRYLHYEQFLAPILKEYENKTISPLVLTKKIGSMLDKSSFLYWAYKNDIDVHAPTLFDSSTGDLIYFFKQRKKFHLDPTDDQKKLTNELLQFDDVSAIILGGGPVKHYTLNANILREGLQRAIYLTTAQEFDGSDSGGNDEEAKSWAKISIKGASVKVKSDFTLTFPLLVAGAFYLK